MSNATSQSELLTREQAAQFLGLRTQTLALWFSTGRNELPAVKLGRAVRYRRSDLEQFLADHTTTRSS